MLDYKIFNTMISKDFIEYDVFYKQILKHWRCNSKREYENIFIFCGENIDLVLEFITKECSSLKTNYNVEINQRAFKDKFIIEVEMVLSSKKKKLLRIEIQSLKNFEIERGIKASSVIFDVDDENRELIDYIEERTIEEKIMPMLVPPTDLKTGLVLYY